MRAATLLALMGVSRPIYHLIILNEAILIVLSKHINIMLLPASHVTYTVYNFTDLINNSVCLSVCLYQLSAKCGENDRKWQNNTQTGMAFCFTGYDKSASILPVIKTKACWG